jgi:hypothetical protein
MWDFVLAMWFARNEIEHNLDSKHVEIHKRKLVEQISWIRKKIDKRVVHPFINITDTALRALPIKNLKIMLEQTQNIYIKNID